MKNYVIIPAKEKSSRCNNKNWRPFIGNLNLVDYLISIIPENYFDLVLLSTDKSLEPVLNNITLHRRDPALATAESPVNDLISVIIDSYQLEEDAYIWLLNPTSPFRKKDDFLKILEVLEREKPGSIISVSKIHPFIWKDHTPLFETNYPRKNTQDFNVKYFIENGQFIVFKIKEFEKTKTWYTIDTQLFEQEQYESMIDIDTEQDFLNAQIWGNIKMKTDTLKNETLMIESVISEPIKEHTQLLFNHFNRYSLAIQKINIMKRDFVIDASCGLGYGSYLISMNAEKVIGLDINRGYLNKAKELFGSHKVSWFTYEEYENTINKGNGSKADKIVCIETLEHISQTQTELFIMKLLKYLKYGGNMFLTVPLGQNLPSEYNEYHLNEPSIDYVYSLFNEKFHSIHLDISTFINSFGYETKYCIVTLEGYTGGKK